MDIIDLLLELGIQAKRTASTKGGEYHSPCPDPNCQGKDRFCVWPSEGTSGRYWCRQCDRSGDAIQFCRDFMNLSFNEACNKVGQQIFFQKSFSKQSKNTFTPRVIQDPSDAWIQSASHFIEECHQYLCQNPALLNSQKDRGITLRSIKDFKLGWNNSNRFESRISWGLPIDTQESQMPTICLPKGIVLPYFHLNRPLRIKIRRHEWLPEDLYPKYHIVNGSKICLSIHGDLSKPIILVEAELDAILIHQLAGDICCCIALGGVANKPDQFTHNLLCRSSAILFALDFDEAGKKAYRFWQSTYCKLKPWPVPRGKSPGDAYEMGINLRQWVIAGLRQD